jgi:hypothetical protein
MQTQETSVLDANMTNDTSGNYLLSLKHNSKRGFVHTIQALSRLLFKSEFCWKMATIVSDEFQLEQARVEARLLDSLVENDETIIRSGAFAGMRYGVDAVGGAILPKIVGSYESQLSDLISGFSDRGYAHAVDIGSAEGYYVVGLARIMPDTKIYAFDIDPTAHLLCRANAERNAVLGQILFKEECTPHELSKAIKGSTLVICDCEGFEAEILDLNLVPRLSQCDILVELHDLIVPGVSQLIDQRFKETHKITYYSEAVPHASAYPVLNGMKKFEASLAMNEKRGGKMQWAFMESNLSRGEKGDL